MQDKVFLEGLRIEATHGVEERERKESQEFLLDIALAFDTQQAAASDRLQDTFDYGRLRRIVAEIFSAPPNYLIERLASRVAARVLEDPRVSEVTITIKKPHVYPDCVPGVTITRRSSSRS